MRPNANKVKKISLTVKLLLSGTFLLPLSPANAALTDGLVAYWNFDDCTAKEIKL